MTAWALRRATLSDLDAIMELETSIFPTDAWSPGMMAAELEGPHGYYLVAVADDAIAGYAGLLAPDGADGDIQTLAVAASHRRTGIGSALLDALLQEASRRGARQVFLEVRADNPAAQQLYRSRGFEQIARRRHYYQPDDVDALVFRLRVGGPG